MESNLKANTLYFRSFCLFWALLLIASVCLTQRRGRDRNHCRESISTAMHHYQANSSLLYVIGYRHINQSCDWRNYMTCKCYTRRSFTSPLSVSSCIFLFLFFKRGYIFILFRNTKSRTCRGKHFKEVAIFILSVLVCWRLKTGSIVIFT